jgi:hypothetical protein
MSFPRHLLGEDEELVLDLRPHWSAVAGPVFAGLVAIAAGLTLPGLVPAWLGGLQRFAHLVIQLAALTVLVWLVAPRIARWLTTQIVLTSDRLILRTGVFTKYAREVRLPLINQVDIRQPVLSRLLGSGDLIVETGSHAHQRRAVFPSVPDPQFLSDQIDAQIDRYGDDDGYDPSYDRDDELEGGRGYADRDDVGGYGRGGDRDRVGARTLPDGTTVPTRGGVVEQLQHLATLRDRGDLSREEFQRLKGELLKRL